jgi:hypothetical protein
MASVRQAVRRTCSPGWLARAELDPRRLKVAGYAGSSLGWQGTLGNADRVAAGLNGLLITGDMVLGGLPVVGEVALAATGIYLAGDFLYQHWTPFHDVANDVGHATVRAADDVGQAADSAWHKVTSFENTLASVGSLF